jgi:hypothetical protein
MIEGHIMAKEQWIYPMLPLENSVLEELVQFKLLLYNTTKYWRY